MIGGDARKQDVSQKKTNDDRRAPDESPCGRGRRRGSCQPRRAARGTRPPGGPRVSRMQCQSLREHAATANLAESVEALDEHLHKRLLVHVLAIKRRQHSSRVQAFFFLFNLVTLGRLVRYRLVGSASWRPCHSVWARVTCRGRRGGEATPGERKKERRKKKRKRERRRRRKKWGIYLGERGLRSAPHLEGMQK